MAMEEIVSLINETVTDTAFGIWFLIGAALVFFMQAGFAMVETGFTRAKNAGNIIMKNLMDFCIGTVVFVLLGFSLMMAEDYVFGFIGIPNLSIFTNFGEFIQENASSFVFNLVFWCHGGYHCIRFHGRTHQVYFLLHLFRRDFAGCLSDRSRLGLESPGLAGSDGLPRFCRVGSHPFCGRCNGADRRHHGGPASGQICP